MTKDDFLTVRWNNLLMLGLGLPALVYVYVALTTPAWSDTTRFIGLAVIGVVY